MHRGLPNEDAEGFSVYANKLTLLEEGAPYEMNIEGRKIEMMPVVKGTWKGYTLYTPVTGSGKTMVVLHRDGILPYTPVTRKQYLDLATKYLNNLYDSMIAGVDEGNKVSLAMGIKPDPKESNEKKEKLQQQKKDVVKYYRDELKATTVAGLLDSAAIIPFAICDPDINHAIFTTESAGGRLLVTENPGYMRKDLPKYIPQLFVLTFGEEEWSAKQKNDALKVVKENFPVVKLQAMIDK
jgi:hypothetical protein